MAGLRGRAVRYRGGKKCCGWLALWLPPRGVEGKSCWVEKAREAGEPGRAGAAGVLSETAARKYRQMTESPIPRLVLSLAWPSIVSNLVTTTYNLADTFFIGRISTSAEGAIGVAFVVMTLIQAVGFYFGQGTGNAMSRYLGMQNQRMADTMASVGVTASFGCGVAIAVLGHAFLVPLCVLAGSTPTILPYARTYIGLIMVGAPWMCAALTLNQQLRFEGESAYAMVAFVSGAVLNFGLAPLLIFVAGLGVAGAGLATIICQFVSFCLLVAGMQRSHVAHLSIGALAGGRDIAREVNNGGLPSLARQLVGGFAITVLNNAARPFGDAAIAAIAIAQRIVSFGNYIQIGIGQGFQPVCGYNYGAGRYERVREGMRFAHRAAFGIVAVVCTVTFAFAPQIVDVFRNDPEVIRIATVTLRFQSVTLALTGVAMITNFALQTTGRMWRATFLGLCRLGLALAPAVAIMSRLFGLAGVEAAQSVADVVTVSVAIPMTIGLGRELREREAAAAKDGAARA